MGDRGPESGIAANLYLCPRNLTPWSVLRDCLTCDPLQWCERCSRNHITKSAFSLPFVQIGSKFRLGLSSAAEWRIWTTPKLWKSPPVCWQYGGDASSASKNGLWKRSNIHGVFTYNFRSFCQHTIKCVSVKEGWQHSSHNLFCSRRLLARLQR